MREESPVSDLITEELRSIRNNVPGVRGSITATSDGLLVAQDLPGLEPTQIAALVATMHAVASRASLSTQGGPVKEVLTRGEDGYLAVYAAGSAAVVGVLGLSDMNVAMLNLQARRTIDRIGEYAADFIRQAPAAPAASLVPPPPPPAPGPPPGYPPPRGYDAGGYGGGGDGNDGYGGGPQGGQPLPRRSTGEMPRLPRRATGELRRATGEWPRYGG